jgi:hypothetical protein
MKLDILVIFRKWFILKCGHIVPGHLFDTFSSKVNYRTRIQLLEFNCVGDFPTKLQTMVLRL